MRTSCNIRTKGKALVKRPTALKIKQEKNINHYFLLSGPLMLGQSIKHYYRGPDVGKKYILRDNNGTVVVVVVALVVLSMVVA